MGVVSVQAQSGHPARARFVELQRQVLDHYGSPAVSRFVRIADPPLQLHVLEAGDGEPVLLVHGGAGYALNWEESVDGVCAVGVALRDTVGQPPAAIAVAVPRSRMADESALSVRKSASVRRPTNSPRLSTGSTHPCRLAGSESRSRKRTRAPSRLARMALTAGGVASLVTTIRAW